MLKRFLNPQPDPVTEFISAAYQFADRTTTSQLFFLAIICWMSGKYLGTHRGRQISQIAAGILLPMYFLHCFTFDANFPTLFRILFRSIFIHQIGASIALVVGTVLSAISLKLISLRVNVSFSIRRFREKAWPKIKLFLWPPKPLPPREYPPPPTLEERLEEFRKEAEMEFNAQVEMLKKLPLEKYEFDALVTREKIKLLRKLKARE